MMFLKLSTLKLFIFLMIGLSSNEHTISTNAQYTTTPSTTTYPTNGTDTEEWRRNVIKSVILVPISFVVIHYLVYCGHRHREGKGAPNFVSICSLHAYFGMNIDFVLTIGLF